MDYNSTNRLEDKQLVRQVLQGDHRAFGVIIKNTERLVGQIVARMIRHPEDRKDIIQDIYLKTFKYLSTFRHEAKLSTWIGNIAYNSCINFLERRKLAPLDEEHYPEHRAGDMETGALIEGRQMAVIVAAGIDELAPLYKTLVVLFHQENLSYMEIGQITGLPEGTIKSYLFRARKQLRVNVLAKYKKDEL